MLAATRTYLLLGFFVLCGAWILQATSHGVLVTIAIVALYVIGIGLIAVGCYYYRQLPWPEPERQRKVGAPVAVFGFIVIAINLGAFAVFLIWEYLLK
ncbi:hypothetical protein LTT02_18640 [Mycolicibacterium smegmatis]|uniref:hypothetical protein n=1 Tax=Mycolicibacterium TaxID=1866885 RepID=UPI0005D8A338|nr:MULTISPECIES: hypothetical protein [Mycolicibacterium]MBU8810780.1 hypothetical protein [Mycolicibacterium goodii]MDF1903829.1 hypothetical protein [Mycolicibacterium smegmatis]MDF1910388.1 hypothetical protein [Mycolicibacterium smegmatis]MDF1922141.1 hypothetical protein [Mycolicibacterium smegmatis]MDF1928717.1 hypothetical protein [Mycolicibacterium smegmatis]